MIYYAITKPDPKKAYAKDADKVAELVYRKVVNGEKKTIRTKFNMGKVDITLLKYTLSIYAKA